MIFFMTVILPIIYVAFFIALFYFIFNISRNSNRQVRFLQEILLEMKGKNNNQASDQADL